MANREIFGWTLEDASKGLAFVAVVVYIIGYLVLSTRFARYGFVASSPFRPRVVETGTSALILTAVPGLVGFAVNKLPRRNLQKRWFVAAKIQVLLGLCAFAVKVPIFTPGEPLEVISKGIWESRVKALVVLPGIVAVLLLLMLLANWAWRSYPRHPLKAFATMSFLDLLVLWLYGPLGTKAERHIFTWFIFIGLSVFWASKPDTIPASRWKLIAPEQTVDTFAGANKAMLSHLLFPVTALFTFLILVSAFSSWVYDYVPFRMGGGELQKVTLSVKVTDEKNQFVKGELIEESDQGFYLVLSNEAEVIYLPKDRVRFLSYSDRTTKLDIGLIGAQ